MILAQLDGDVETIWWITLLVGLVVAIVVVALLQTLYRSVKRIETNVIALWEQATRVARNTATTWLLNDTADSLEDLREEARRHDEFLSKRGGT